jgi:hypothetical protein
MLRFLLDAGLDLDRKAGDTTLRATCAKIAQMNDRSALYAWLHGKPVEERVIAEERRARKEWEDMRDGIARGSGKEPGALGPSAKRSSRKLRRWYAKQAQPRSHGRTTRKSRCSALRRITVRSAPSRLYTKPEQIRIRSLRTA